jgi:hypothetical protein
MVRPQRITLRRKLPRKGADGVAARIRPLPEDIRPSEIFRARLRRRLLQFQRDHTLRDAA